MNDSFARHRRGGAFSPFLVCSLMCCLAFAGTERCPQKGVVKQVASKLLRALSEKGLALLVNHGIPECKV